MKSIVKFFQDFFGAFLHFFNEGILEPLFFKFPRMYEALVSFIIVFKNSIPDKFEISYTINHWKYVIQRGMVDSLMFTSFQIINFTKFLNQNNVETLNKIERLMYVSNRDK